MAVAHVLGFPRIGAKRELKTALEAFWRSEIPESELWAAGRELRNRRWLCQRDAGLDLLTVGDFAWYDSVLQTVAHLGCIPGRFGFDPRRLTLPQYFTLARGSADQAAMEMTKWFDTNYHYLVPEWSADTRFDGGVQWLFEEIAQTRELGHAVKVALVGPLTLLYLGKIKSGLSHKLDLLPSLVPAYRRLLARINVLGVSWVQIDEPILGLDLVRGPGQLATFLDRYPESKVLSLGVVDGRNIWRADLDAALAALEPARDRLGERLWISASCSLLHVPVDLVHEQALDREVRSWLAFAAQKLEEIVALKRGLAQGIEAIAPALAASRDAVKSRRRSERVRSDAVRRRLDAVSERDTRRPSPFA